MNVVPRFYGLGWGRFQRAFTLIEMVAVLTIIAILAAVIIPSALKRLDQIAGDNESAHLKLLSDALQASVLRSHAIPTYTNWAVQVASELGRVLSDVQTNERFQPRFFLVDPSFQVGAGVGLPYSQTAAGSILPINPRLIILSSVGQPLASMVSGVPSGADFGAIWNWSDGSKVPPAGGLFTGFTQGEDLKVQRLNLGSQFIHLVLTVYPTANNPGGNYSIDPIDGAKTAVPTNGVDAYYLQASRLRLYATNTIDSEQLLSKDSSFVYDGGNWRSSISGVPPLAGILDFAGLIPSFLAAPANPGSGTTQQQVLNSMKTYMQAYSAWAGTSPPFNDNTLRSAALSAQAVMINTLNGLYTPNPAN